MTPGLLEGRRWYGGAGLAAVELADTVELGSVRRSGPAADADGGGAEAGGILALVDAVDDRGVAGRYLLPFVLDARDGAARAAEPGDGVWRALAMAMADGRVLGSDAGGALVCRPALALPAFAPGGAREIADWAERALGADQSNTSSVLGERLLLKAFRRLAPGLNPELEMAAFLAEERELPLVPALAGSAEYVGPDGAVVTVAMLQELVPDAADVYETTAERLAGWIAAPGVVALEFATEDAAELGATVARLHATLAGAGDVEAFGVRPAAPADRAAWHADALAALSEAVALLDDEPILGPEIRTWEPRIRDRLAALEPATGGDLPDARLLMRIHGDLHLGQILRTPGGFVVIDFEGDPLRPIDERRRVASPLRDVASLLLSLDHVSTDAERRVGAAGWRPGEHAGLDVAAWRRRSRERLVRGYRDTLRRAGSPIAVDEVLLDALMVAKEIAEFVYAATYLPSWLWAPEAGMRRLIDGEPVGEVTR